MEHFDEILHNFKQEDIILDEFIKDFDKLDPDRDKMTNVSPTFFYSTTKALIKRIRELEELNEAHRKLNGELQTKLTELEGGNAK